MSSWPFRLNRWRFASSFWFSCWTLTSLWSTWSVCIPFNVEKQARPDWLSNSRQLLWFFCDNSSSRLGSSERSIEMWMRQSFLQGCFLRCWHPLKSVLSLLPVKSLWISYFFPVSMDSTWAFLTGLSAMMKSWQIHVGWLDWCSFWEDS